MKKINEQIQYQGKEIARIIYAHKIDGLEFFTEDNSFMQVGIHNKEANATVVPHAHVCNPFMIDRMEEVFFIVEGKVLVTLFDQLTGIRIQEVTLKTGDTMIHFGQGHGLTFLEPTVLFEVKQGPFKGTSNSKIYFNNKT